MVLFLALVLLAVLTALGMTGARTTRLEEQMARNEHDAMLAFLAAEAALRDGRDWLAANAPDPATSFAGQGLYRAAAWGAADPWAGAAVWRDGGSRAGTTLPGVARRPRHVIEWLATVDRGDGSGTRVAVDVFRVTALGTGGTGNAEVMLQATFGRVRGSSRLERLSWRELDRAAWK